MTITTQQRLDSYLRTEAEILQAQEVRGNDRTYRMADLTEVRKAIADLQAQVGREAAAKSGAGLRHSVGNLNR